MKPFDFTPGNLPLLLSIPHAGTALTPEVARGLSPAAQGLCDTDWHIPQLYHFVAEMGASVLIGNYSRFVIDLNRPADNQPLYATATTGLYPETLFDGTPTFNAGMTPDAAQRRSYLETLWHPYHQQLQQELARLKSRFGYALLFDAHSIASQIPRLFEGKLPDLNLGTNDGASCHPDMTAKLEAVCAAQSDFSWVINGRFKGGYITRAYGQPANGVQALQLELAQCNYMDEAPPFLWCDDRAQRLRPLLKKLIEALLSS
ncbi:N-formylglutamate deformylase [Erwinia sp. OLTSP20]|uniref:N-formylglutamate deformylase n=1 Tax=unclassified Erwinia TaxID=2622719 RepID=UPI000C17E1F6|nr:MULTISPECIES: N-formylglutamate deformylase [unclassified Erwinia]PIJ48845.1 N-formylglutamate deformylase [Erwinia sp. OAMSP11]PIJ69467.1 N-formylglutamate deformylase [Erwinia sp. OLSSP12]PIJ79301.1 N-formylglutamate deformylase [Erwinia sp. OLCASP19]PIJ80827.1 N-formylglutamate deformylase [Erwinia sp. OLMTSP26]PIJ82979.1 N-formylglutamate deformylase [Erwinia sp. OLMDSP33]